MATYEPMAGEDIRETATKIVAMAAVRDEPVRCDFNDIELVANPGGDTANEIVARYNDESRRLAEAYRNSPEGRASAARAEQASKRAAESAAEGIKPFSIRDPDGWAKCVENNSDPYGACVVRYAARWANLMEARMAAGAELEAIAKDTSHEADTEGITGFMYGAAVSILAGAWEHGERLRRWHNRDTQLGTEGDRANETGGVLNPAVLSIG